MDVFDKHINALTKEDWEELYLNRRMSLDEIARKYALTTKVITNRLNSFGIKRRRVGARKVYSIPEEEIKRLYVDKALSIRKVAQHFGCSDAVVRKKLKELGILRVSRPGSSLTKEFLEDKLKDSSPIELSKELGISVPTIYKAIHRAGIPVGNSKSDYLDDNIIEAISILYSAGKSCNFISKVMGLAVGSVLRALDKTGVQVRSGNYFSRKIPPDDIVSEMYLEGKSVGQIAEEVGASKGAVQQSLERTGTKYRSKSESLMGNRNHMKGQKHTNETRSKMSSAYARDIRELPNGPRGNPTPLDTPNQGTVITRSSWEAKVGEYLTSLGIDYLYEPHKLELTVDGVECTYTPDFYLTEEDTYIEVKGILTEESAKKVKAATKSGYNIVIWDHLILKILGIL